MKKFLTLTLCLLLCATAFTGCAATKEQREIKKTLKLAVQLLEDGKTQEAYDAFWTIKDHPEAAQYLSHFVFRYARKTTTDFAEDTETLYEYDAYGRIVKITHSVDNGVHPVSTNVTWYEYDEKNRVIKYGMGGHATLYEYDQNGNIAKVTKPNGNTAEFTYDAQGNVTQEIYKDVDGKTYLCYTHEYNEHGDVVLSHKKHFIYSSGEFTFTHSYEYDQNGRMIKRVSDTVTDAWEYDELGREIKYILNQENWHYKRYIRTTEYDAYGNYAKQTHTNVSLDDSESSYTNVYERDYNNYGIVLWEKCYSHGELLRTTTYSDFSVYYNPYGEPEIPDAYLGTGA
jgi:YD repeat-containing protein